MFSPYTEGSDVRLSRSRFKIVQSYALAYLVLVLFLVRVYADYDRTLAELSFGQRLVCSGTYVSISTRCTVQMTTPRACLCFCHRIFVRVVCPGERLHSMDVMVTAVGLTFATAKPSLDSAEGEWSFRPYHPLVPTLASQRFACLTAICGH